MFNNFIQVTMIDDSRKFYIDITKIESFSESLTKSGTFIIMDSGTTHIIAESVDWLVMAMLDHTEA